MTIENILQTSEHNVRRTVHEDGVECTKQVIDTFVSLIKIDKLNNNEQHYRFQN